MVVQRCLSHAYGRWVLALLLAAGGLLGVFSWPNTSPPAQAQGGGFVPGQYIVVLKNTVPSPDQESAQLEQKHALQRLHIFRRVIKGFSAKIPPGQLRALQSEPTVEYVEQDRYVFAVRRPSPPPSPSPTPSVTGIYRINADKNPYKSSVGTVHIAILDTGVGPHSALNIQGGVDVTGVGYTTDDNGHGTHVAGTAAARSNGTVVGVAPGAPIHPVKVLDRNGSGFLSWIIAGMDWVTQNAGTIAVANMSLGFSGSDTAFDQSLNNSVAAGVTYVVAAGNSSTSVSTFSPANNPNVISVAAIADSDGKCGGLGGATGYGADDTFASFSNYGATLAAPGVNIYSCAPGGGYRTLSGTSMASPHVAGTAALYIAAHGRVSAAAIRSALVGLAIPKTYPCGSSVNQGGYSGGRASESLVNAGSS